MIDSLSKEVIKEDLSYINAADILGASRQSQGNKPPDLLSIEYLLDIFNTFNQWVDDQCKSISDNSSSRGSGSSSSVRVSSNGTSSRLLVPGVKTGVKNVSSTNSGSEKSTTTSKERASRKSSSSVIDQSKSTYMSFRLHMSPSYNGSKSDVIAKPNNSSSKKIGGELSRNGSSESLVVRKRIVSKSSSRERTRESSQVVIAKK